MGYGRDGDGYGDDDVMGEAEMAEMEVMVMAMAMMNGYDDGGMARDGDMAMATGNGNPILT